MVDVYRKIKFEEPDNNVNWSDQELDVPDGENVVESSSVSPDVLVDGPKAIDLEDEDPIMEVMLKSIQDPDLSPIYEGLPDLG